jgi:hypothetical protein
MGESVIMRVSVWGSRLTLLQDLYTCDGISSQLNGRIEAGNNRENGGRTREQNASIRALKLSNKTPLPEKATTGKRPPPEKAITGKRPPAEKAIGGKGHHWMYWEN